MKVFPWRCLVLMMSNIYAKSNPAETLVEHTTNLLKVYEDMKHVIKNDVVSNYNDYIRLICNYHDMGKANIPFQNLIRKALGLKHLAISDFNKVLPHEWLSLSFITEEDEAYFHSLDLNGLSFYDLACYSIAFHHNRSVVFNQKELKLYIEEIDNNRSLLEIDYELFPVTDIKGIRLKIESPEYWPAYFPYVVYFKGILHKCDYAASAHIKAEQTYRNGNYPDHFTAGLKIKGITELRDYQQQAADYSDKSIIFIESTGARKTEYSMNWINGDKSFYLLGLRTAVNAMYQRFTDMFTEDNVGLLHGESIYRLLDDTEYSQNYEENGDIFIQHSKVRQLSMPITVATADQLIPSVFKFLGFEFYYFTASYSKIVIDEIQSFAPEAIASIVVFLKEIQRLGGKFLLMTATLPSFVIKEFDELEQAGTLVKQTFFCEQKRHLIKFVDNNLICDTAEQIIENALKANKKVLVISNTVAGAQSLANQYSKYNPQLLHSRFIRTDRKSKEDEILAETDYTNHPENKNQPCLWISTQIVEASLDIDFDILLTENAPIDALFQRFGRCWRRREYNLTEPNIYIFNHDSITYRIYDKHLTDKTWYTLQKYNLKFLTEETKQKIIEEVFSDIEDTKYFKDYKKNKELLVLGMRAGSKSEAATLFRNINNNYIVIPEPVFEKHKDKIEQLFTDIENRGIDVKERYKLKNKLYGYTVPIQITGNRKELLRDIWIDNKRMQKLDIRILTGVNYTEERGVEFIKDFKTLDNFIF